MLPEGFCVLIDVDLLDHIKSLSDELLLDDLEELVLLEGFTGDVQWEIIRIDNTSDELEVFWHHISEVIGDKDTSNIHLSKKQ